MFELENKGQSDGAQHPQSCHWMANIRICKGHYAFCEILTFQICDVENLCQGCGMQHLQLCNSTENFNRYKRHSPQFYATSHHFRNINFSNACPWKRRSTSPNTTFVVMPFGGEHDLYKSYRTHFTLALSGSDILNLKCLTLKIHVKGTVFKTLAFQMLSL